MKDIFTSTDELIEEFNEKRIRIKGVHILLGVERELKGQLEVFKAWKEDCLYNTKGQVIHNPKLIEDLSSQIKKIEEVLNG